MKSNYHHASVLVEELISLMQPKPGDNFIDGTLGGGGHTAEILQQISPNGKVLAFEQDQRAIKAAQGKLKQYQDRLFIVNKNYTHLLEEWQKLKNELPTIQGIFFDLGLSSDQLDKANRGFSFKDDGPLDMRFNPQNQELTASEIIMTWPEDKLTKIFWEYGQERNSPRLAAGPLKNRSSWTKQKQNMLRTSMLVRAILQILRIDEKELPRFRIHPATKVFQALRIAVNQELLNIQKVLPQATEILASGGRLAIISFHSLEDKIVKAYFKEQTKDCVCPKSAPVCTCNNQPQLKIITKKAIKPSLKEKQNNPRSRSAILRVAEKI